jgi:hypothetical protein
MGIGPHTVRLLRVLILNEKLIFKSAVLDDMSTRKSVQF